MAPRGSISAALRSASAPPPAASTARTRGVKRAAPSHVKAAAAPLPAVSVSSPRAVVEVFSDAAGQLVLPIRFQCPLCFDVLRAPIQLPCCARHLCTECFERALELTSVNCGFCRKRLVGLARKKQYKVDDALWTEIQRCCPFVAYANGASDATVDVEFLDENAPLLRSSRERGDHGADHDHDHDHDHAAASVQQTTASKAHDDDAALAIALDVSPVARTRRANAADSSTKIQRRLEAFFAGTLPSPPANTTGSRPSSAGSVRSLRLTTNSSSSSSSPSSAKSGGRGRGRRRFDAVVKKPLLRSSSHSPKHRTPQTMPRTLLQLTLHSPVGRSTRQGSSLSSSKGNAASKVTTRPRRPWRCRHCTYENTCFDTCCSMCRQYPATAPMHT